jgi:hypothetical protein
LVKALKAAFPEYNWQLWRFDKVPKGSWDDETQVRNYFHWLADCFNVETLEDWRKIPAGAINASVLRKVGGLCGALSNFFPSEHWRHLETGGIKNSTQSKRQNMLLQIIHQLLPGVDTKSNYKHPEIMFATNARMELDIFLPSMALAFEYHGEQHFGWHFFFGSPKAQKERDAEKHKACKELGITLVEIPYWWDGTAASLAATILNCRPGNFHKDAFVMPSELQQQLKERPTQDLSPIPSKQPTVLPTNVHVSLD